MFHNPPRCVSDHLPLVMHISVTETEPSDAISHNTRAQSWPSWKNMCNNDAYNSVLSDKLSLLPQLLIPQNLYKLCIASDRLIETCI